MTEPRNLCWSCAPETQECERFFRKEVQMHLQSTHLHIFSSSHIFDPLISIRILTSDVFSSSHLLARDILSHLRCSKSSCVQHILAPLHLQIFSSLDAVEWLHGGGVGCLVAALSHWELPAPISKPPIIFYCCVKVVLLRSLVVVQLLTRNCSCTWRSCGVFTETCRKVHTN